MRVVVLPVVALERAVDEVRVRRAQDPDEARPVAREAVLLQDRPAEVECEAARDRERLRVGDPIGPGQEHDLAEARRGLFVEELLKAFGGPDGVRLDGGLVVARVVDDLRLLERLPRLLPGLRVEREGDDVARRVRALLLHDRGLPVRADEDDALAVAVVSDAVRREVCLGHPVDLVRGDREILGVAHAEIVDDAVRLAPLRVLRPDAHLVVARGEPAEVELGVAARKVLEREDRRLAVDGTVLEKGGEAVRIVEEADLRGVEVRHEEADLHVLLGRDGRLHVVGRDVRIPELLRRRVALALPGRLRLRRGIREVARQDRLRGGADAREGDGDDHVKDNPFSGCVHGLFSMGWLPAARRNRRRSQS